MTEPNPIPEPARYEPHDTVREVLEFFDEMDPADFASVCRSPGVDMGFLRVAQAVLEPRGRLAGDAVVGIPEAERRWAQGVHLAAALHKHKLARPRARAGESLAAFFKEARLNRLLEVSGPLLFPEARRVVSHAISKRAPMDPADLIDLLLTDGTERRQSSRIRIARDYVRAQHHNR